MVLRGGLLMVSRWALIIFIFSNSSADRSDVRFEPDEEDESAGQKDEKATRKQTNMGMVIGGEIWKEEVEAIFEEFLVSVVCLCAVV